MNETTDKRALVIGSLLPPLRGVEADANAMATLLRERGFHVDLRLGDRASRAGILQGYEDLIAKVDSNGAAVVFYAGHGGYALNASPEAGERERLQCIFPTDWTEAGEFRAILDIELSGLLARLTDKTKNATLILDCCHAGELSRGPGDPVDLADPEALVPRVYGAGWARGVPEFLAKHRELDLVRVDVESNPHAVRMVASAPDRRAFETTVAIAGENVVRGLFTSTLERVLAETGAAPITWQTVANRVRELIVERSREQLPGVEGPADRLLFTTQVVKRPDAVVFFRDAEQTPFLRASRLLGAAVGAVYDVMPVGVVEHDRAAVVARATIVALVGTNARVELEVVAAQPAPGTLAFPVKLPYLPLPISVEGSTADELKAVVYDLPSIEVVADPTQARFSIVCDGTTLSALDAGVLAGTPLDDGPAGRALLVQRLERWAKAESVRALTTEGLAHDALEVQWGRVERGQQVPHGPGARMHVGESVYVTVTNRSERSLYVAIFDVGIAGKVTLLTAASPTGRKLDSQKSFTLGKRDTETIVRGVGPFTWPDDVPSAAERRESLVVIAASSWADFTALQTELLPTRSRGPNRLETILERFRVGQYRDLPAEAPAPELEGFCVHRIDFDLSPTGRSNFAIDQALDQRGFAEAIALAPRSSARALPRRIAVRIDEITVHRNRAAWGTAKIRVDVLALTGADTGGAFHAHTEPFSRIGDGDRLPFDNLLVYEGPVERFVDFSIWVSRDTQDEKTLRQLLDAASGDEHLKAALGTLAGLAVAAPAAAVIAGAGLAIGTVVSFSSKLIEASVSASVGLYRRSFLPHEQFGLGRHPAQGVMRAQDFSFALTIVEVA